MPALRNHQSTKVTKMLLVGDTGGGKTGALASLAAAGYNLRILDMDNGIDLLRNLLDDPKSTYPKDALDRVAFVTVTDKMKNVNGKLIPSKTEAWQRAVKLLDNWKTEDEDLGPISTWTPQEVLVIDSLTMLGTAATNFILAMNGRLGQKPFLSDFGDAGMLVEHLLQMLYAEEVNCNVIVNTHITYVGDKSKGEMVKGYPSCVGSSLPQKVGRYFNTLLLAQSNPMGKREILTKSSPFLELKNTAPLRVKDKYPIETGLADYFREVRGPSA